MAESDRLLSREAGGLGPGSGVGGLGVDHSSAFTAGGLGSPQHQAAAAPSPPRPPYTCYLYAAMDIYSRYKVGLILPTLVGSDAQGAVTG